MGKGYFRAFLKGCSFLLLCSAIAKGQSCTFIAGSVVKQVDAGTYAVDGGIDRATPGEDDLFPMEIWHRLLGLNMFEVAILAVFLGWVINSALTWFIDWEARRSMRQTHPLLERLHKQQRERPQPEASSPVHD